MQGQHILQPVCCTEQRCTWRRESVHGLGSYEQNATSWWVKVLNQREDGGCPKNSAQKAIKHNIQVSAGLQIDLQGWGGRVQLVARWVDLFLFAGFIPKGDVWFYLQDWCWGGDMPHEAVVDLTRQNDGEMFVRVPDVGEQLPRFPEFVVIKSGFRADESSRVSSLWKLELNSREDTARTHSSAKITPLFSRRCLQWARVFGNGPRPWFAGS